MAEQTNFYRAVSYGDEIKPTDKMKIERHIYFQPENADISRFTALPLERLQAMRGESAQAEQRIFTSLREQSSSWEQQAAVTLLLDRAIEYVKTPAIKHSSNRWIKDPVNNDFRSMSNMVYKMITHAMLDNMFQKLFEKGLSQSTVRYAQRILSVSLEAARKYRYIEHNPARDIITKFGKQGKTPDPYTIEQVKLFMSKIIGTEWEMPVVLGGLYGLRMSEIIGLRWQNVDLENMKFGIVEQMPFKLPQGTKIITEMAPTKSNDRILPITEVTLPYFLRQLELQERQKSLAKSGGGEYFYNDLVIAKADGSPQRRDRMSNYFGQLVRRLEMPHIRFHDLRHSAATNMHQLTGDFYTVGEILGHTLKGIGMSLGISTNLEAVTARYVDVRLERKKEVLDIYHKAVHSTGMNDKQDPGKKAKNKSSDIEL